MTIDSSAEHTPESVGASGPYHSLRVARIVRETADARSFVLDVPEHLRETFAYRAGQFLTFRVTVAGERLVRCYSLASSPESDSEHKVTVKRIEEGRVSNWLNDEVSVGSELEVMRPAGHFCLRDSPSPIVLFSGGSGITPVISIVKSALRTTDRRLKLVYANRDEDSIIFRDELALLAECHPERLALSHRLDVRDGFIDEGAARAEAFEAAGAGADFYVCGPGPFMDVVESALRGLGVERDRIYIERFVSLTSEGRGEEAERPPPEVAAGEGPCEKIAVEIDGRTHELAISAGETVLEAALRAELDPPFSCQEGYCGCCMAKLREGSVEMRANDVLDAEALSEGWVLTCQSVPTSRTCRIEYPD